MRKILVTILFAIFMMLCGCYRQTTIILQPGQTLPPHTDTVESTAADSTPQVSSAETEAVKQTEAATAKPDKSNTQPSGSKETKQKSDPPETGSSATIPSTSDAPAETSEPTEMSPPIEITMPVETAAPLETTVPVESTAPVEATTPTESIPQTAPTTSTEPEPTQHPVYDISNHSVGSFERIILGELNHRREAEGLSTLSMNTKLAALSTIRAYECSMNWGHTRPDGRGWSTLLSDYGYSASVMAENVLYASSGTGATALVDAWMSSNSHKANILRADFSSAGVGIYHANGYVYVAVLFAG